MYEIVPRSECEMTPWNFAVDHLPSAWAWHRFELLEARLKWRSTTDYSFCVREISPKGEIVAVVPLVHIKARLFQTILGGHLESTGGPAIDLRLPRRSRNKVQDMIWNEVAGLAQKLNARRADFSCPPLAPYIRSINRPVPNPLCCFGVNDTSTQSWVLEIGAVSTDELWKGLEHRSRKEIKKAERNDLVAEIATPSIDILEHYYELHIMTCDRNSIPQHPKAYFRSIFDEIARAGLCKTCVVRYGQKILTIQNFLVYKGAAIYWTVASHEDALTLSANDYGMWKAIQYFHGNGLKYVECGEAFPFAKSGKLRGLNDFKKSFGGELYPYYRGSCVFRPIQEAMLGVVRHFRSGGAAT